MGNTVRGEQRVAVQSAKCKVEGDVNKGVRKGDDLEEIRYRQSGSRHRGHTVTRDAIAQREVIKPVLTQKAIILVIIPSDLSQAR